MPSLARKTLLQMVATCHKHRVFLKRHLPRANPHSGDFGTCYLTISLWSADEEQARCRTFAELSGIMPPRWEM